LSCAFVTYRAAIGLLALLTCLHPSFALAWGDRGHRITAAIAYGRLTLEVRKAVDGLLADDAQDRLTAPDFVSRSTWADKLLLQDRDTPVKFRYNASRLWHFSEFRLDGGSLAKACLGFHPLPKGRLASEGPPRDCILNKVEQFAEELADPAVNRKERILALKFLIHLVGDLHQPLNVTDNDDYSGRAVKVHLSHGAKGQGIDLQQYWAINLVEQSLASPTESDKSAAKRFLSGLTSNQMQDMSSGGPRDWTLETVEVARAVVYDFSGVERISDGRRGAVVYASPAYDARAVPAVKDQLIKAGLRLARLLNDTLTSRPQDAGSGSTTLR
jgi:nuclease S1